MIRSAKIAASDQAASVGRILRVFVIGIQGLGFMPVPSIDAVPRAAVAPPPLAAMRAPGSREFLNCCPLRKAAGEGWVTLLRLTVLFEMPVVVPKLDWRKSSVSGGVLARVVFVAGILTDREG